MRPPSRDHIGLGMSYGLVNEVNCTGFEPSLLHTHSSKLPERFELNTIRLPSGEYCASWSMRVDEMRSTGDPFVGCPPFKSSFQISTSTVNCVYARRPCRDIAGCITPSPVKARRSGLVTRDPGRE